MKTSELGIALIAAEEGIVLRAYKCPAGVWTIGIGHTSAAGAPRVVPGMTITRKEAFRLLRRDLVSYETRVTKRLGAVPENVADGAVSFDYNTGAIPRASWVPKYLKGALDAAEKSFKQWNKGGGRVLKGLVRRRRVEADLIFRGIYPKAILDAVADAPDAEAAAEILESKGKPSVSRDVEEIKSFQKALAALGFYKGDIDGIPGDLTVGAVRNFQRAHALDVTGEVGPAERALLQREVERLRGNQASTVGGGVAGSTTGAGEVAQNTVPHDGVAPANDVVQALDVNLWLVLGAAIAAAALIWGGFWLWRNRGRLTGRRVPT